MAGQHIVGIVKVPNGRTVVSQGAVDAVRIGQVFDVVQVDPVRSGWLWAIRLRACGTHVAYARWADGAHPAAGVLTVTHVSFGAPGSGTVVEDFAGTVM